MDFDYDNSTSYPPCASYPDSTSSTLSCGGCLDEYNSLNQQCDPQLLFNYENNYSNTSLYGELALFQEYTTQSLPPLVELTEQDLMDEFNHESLPSCSDHSGESLLLG